MDEMSIIEEKLKQVKVIEAVEDTSYGGNKVYVVLQLPLSEPSVDLEQFFQMDALKQVAIREASKVINRSAGWSNIGPIKFYVGDTPIDSRTGNRSDADNVRVTYTCLGAL